MCTYVTPTDLEGKFLLNGATHWKLPRFIVGFLLTVLTRKYLGVFKRSPFPTYHWNENGSPLVVVVVGSSFQVADQPKKWGRKQFPYFKILGKTNFKINFSSPFDSSVLPRSGLHASRSTFGWYISTWFFFSVFILSPAESFYVLNLVDHSCIFYRDLIFSFEFFSFLNDMAVGNLFWKLLCCCPLIQWWSILFSSHPCGCYRSIFPSHWLLISVE